MKWRSDHCSCDCDLSNRKVSPKNVFGIRTNGLCVSAAVLYQLSYEDPYVGSRPIYWIHRTRERNEALKTFFKLTLRLLKSQSQLWWSHLHFIRMSAAHIIFICFIPFTGTMNLIHWPAPNVWVFIAQLVEHCSANAEAMGSNPVEAQKHFSA